MAQTACWASKAAADEAERLGYEQAEEALLERKQAEIRSATRAALMAALDNGQGADFAGLIAAIAAAEEAGSFPGYADTITAARGEPAGLRRWVLSAIEQAATDAADAYTVTRLRADLHAEAELATEPA